MSVHIKSAFDLIKIIHPQELTNIRTLFSGTKINLETFSRTIRTYVPKFYITSEELIDELALAIIDLFEELDSDTDGFITWSDFISYYTEASNSSQFRTQQSKEKSVFTSVINQTNQISGKLCKIQIEPTLPNGAQFGDLIGSSILNVHCFNDQYFIITQLAVYQSDSSFLFPKLIFEPTPKQLHQVREQNVTLDQKTREKLETIARKKLIQMDPQRFGSDTKFDLLINHKEDQEQKKGDGLTQTVEITCSRLLFPLPYIVVCVRAPMFVIISFAGQVGITEPIKLETQATCIDFDPKTNKIYFGHQSGAVSAYQFTVLQSQEQKQLEKTVDVMTSQERLNLLLKKKHGKKEDIVANFTEKDLVFVYPEIKQYLIHTHDEDTAEVKEKKIKERLELKSKVESIMQINGADQEIIHLVTGNIFNPHISTMESHGIRATNLILEDPKAFIEASVLPPAQSLAIHEKKHGGTQVYVKCEMVISKFITSTAVKIISSGYGNWEDLYVDNHFRLVVAGGDGSVTIIDEQLEVVTCFPELHKEGLLNVFAVNDTITSIGYEKVYQINSQAIHQNYVGRVVKKEEIPDYETTSSKHIVRDVIEVTSKKLEQGNLIKTKTMIQQIPPPRPGSPILCSFLIGNIVGVIDFNYVITMFQAQSGAHITRTTLNVPGLIGMKFGQCSYHPQKDIGILPIGKSLFSFKIVPSESNEAEVFNYLQKVEQTERENQNDQVQKEEKIVSQSLTLQSICKVMNGYVINPYMQELALITNAHEIMIFSMSTGMPVRQIDLVSLNAKMSDQALEEERHNEYNVVETNDLNSQYVENQKDCKEGNTVFITNDKRKNTQQKLRQIKQVDKTKQNLLSVVGNKIQSIQIDKKGRILFIIGTIGVITVYWKTGCLFDNTSVGEVGAMQYDSMNTLVNNPFNQKASKVKESKKDVISGSLECYSLNLDLSQQIVRSETEQANQVLSRAIIDAYDKDRYFYFICDSQNPQDIKAITFKPSLAFITEKTNKRILEYFNCSTFDEQLFSNRPILHKFSFLLENEFFQQQKKSLKGFLIRKIDMMTDKDMPEKTTKQSYYTAMTISSELSLFIAGTSDGRIVMYDTDSTKLVRQGTIQLPFALNIEPVINLCVCGSYPILFAATPTSCFLYTIRPVSPIERLLCCFRHSNYHCVNYPLNVDHIVKTNLFIRELQYLLKDKIDDFIVNQAKSQVQNNFILQTYLQYDQEIKNNRRFFDPNEIQKMVESQKQKGSIQSVAQTFGQKSSMRNLSALGNSVNLDKALLQFKTKTLKIEKHEEEREALTESQSRARREKSTRTQTQKDVVAIFTQMFKFEEKYVSESQVKGQQVKKKKTAFFKIKAAVNLLCFNKTLLMQAMQNPSHMVINKEYVKSLKVVQEQEDEDDLLIQTSVKVIPKAIKDKVKLSKQTKKIISDYQKSRTKREKEVEAIVYDASLTKQEIQEKEFERLNLVPKTVFINGVPQQIPVRMSAVDSLRDFCGVSSSYFAMGTCELLVGDDKGYVSGYSLKELFKLIGVKPAEPKKKQASGLQLEQMTGYQEQKLTKLSQMMQVQENSDKNPDFVHVGKLKPMFNSNLIETRFGIRVADQALISVSVINSFILAISEDRTASFYSLGDLSLQGMFSRIDLAPPPENWQKLFGPLQDNQVVQQSQAAKAQSEKKLQLEDLQPAPKISRPAAKMRIDMPQAAKYPFGFKFQLEASLVSSQKSVQGQVLGQTKAFLTQHIPVPTFDTEEKNLYKTTSLTPQLLEKNKESWTVRALVGRASGFRIDSHLSRSQMVMSNLSTKINGLKAESEDDSD